MNKLSCTRQAQIVLALNQGMSLRAISRLLNVHRTTVMQLLVDVGKNCDDIMAEYMRNLDMPLIEIDETWTFCGMKQYRLAANKQGAIALGDQYVYYALDPRSKLIPAYLVGKRNSENTYDFLVKLKRTLNGLRPQISTDAWQPYAEHIPDVFGRGKVHHATIEKEIEKNPDIRSRQRSTKVSKIKHRVKHGSPDPRYISTSHVERANLTLRTFQCRFTRFSLGFSRKIENLRAAVGLHFAFYNFCWIP